MTTIITMLRRNTNIAATLLGASVTGLAFDLRFLPQRARPSSHNSSTLACKMPT